MGRSDLAPQQRQLRVIEVLVAPHVRKLHGKVGARDGRHVGGDVGEGRAQGRDGGVPEVISWLYALYLVERCVPRAHDRHGPGRHGRTVEGCQVPGVAQRLECADHGGEGGRAIGLDVHEEVEGLARGRVVDAIFGGATLDEAAVWVLGLEDGQDGLDVQAVEGPLGGQSGLLVADVEGVVV